MTTKTYHFGIDLRFKIGDQIWFADKHHHHKDVDWGACPLCKEGKVTLGGRKLHCPNGPCCLGRVVISVACACPLQGEIIDLELTQKLHWETRELELKCSFGVRAARAWSPDIRIWHDKAYATEEEALVECRGVNEESLRTVWEDLAYPPTKRPETTEALL